MAGRGGVRRGSMRRSGSSKITGCNIGPMPESARWPIGRITLAAKRPGKRRTGNPSAPFEVAGVGDGLTANLHGHEAGNGGHSQGEPTEYRANPRPDRLLLAPPCGVLGVRLSRRSSPPSIWALLIGRRGLQRSANAPKRPRRIAVAGDNCKVFDVDVSDNASRNDLNTAP